MVVEEGQRGTISATFLNASRYFELIFPGHYIDMKISFEGRIYDSFHVRDPKSF